MMEAVYGLLAWAEMRILGSWVVCCVLLVLNWAMLVLSVMVMLGHGWMMLKPGWTVPGQDWVLLVPGWVLPVAGWGCRMWSWCTGPVEGRRAELSLAVSNTGCWVEARMGGNAAGATEVFGITCSCRFEKKKKEGLESRLALEL